MESDQIYRFSLPYLVLEKGVHDIARPKKSFAFVRKKEEAQNRFSYIIIGKRMHCCRRSAYKISLRFVATEIYKLDGCTGLNSLHL